MKYSHWFALGGLGASSAAGILLYTMPGVWPHGFAEEPEISVHVVRARLRTEPVHVRASGKILPSREVDIASRLAGKVLELRFKVGDRVRAGEIVAIIQSNTLTQRITQTESALNAARSELTSRAEELTRAEKELVRRRELHEEDLIARRDVEQAAAAAETARAQAELARARVAQHEAMLAQARTLDRFTRIAAPVNGVIQRRWVEPGATVAESSPLLTVAEAKLRRAMVSIPAADSPSVRVGMSAEILDPAAPDKAFDGKVAVVDQQNKEGHRAVEIEIDISAAPQLRPDTAINATIITGKHEDAIWVPRSAVVADKSGSYVYKIVDDRASRQDVGVADSRHGAVRITRGVEDGEVLIADNRGLVKSGSRVRVDAKP
jgi:RND family efflux transporter MFP subunit